jgi:Uma2 family endonuclease
MNSIGTVNETPAQYGTPVVTPMSRSRTHVLLHGVSWNTFERLIEETGEDRKALFAYDNGDFEIREWREGCVMLRNVSWDTYCTLLRETGDERKCRMAYSNGELEIMAPSGEHEDFNLQLHDMVTILLRELKIPYRPLGHMTVKRDHVKKGIEPDMCYYIRNYPLVRGLRGRELDSQDIPVPDLMVEVDIHNSSLNKLKLCERLGVLEHWRIRNAKLEIRILKDGQYERTEESAAFPGIRVQKIAELLQEPALDSYERLDAFQDWIRQHLRPKPPRRTGKKRP